MNGELSFCGCSEAGAGDSVSFVVLLGVLLCRLEAGFHSQLTIDHSQFYFACQLCKLFNSGPLYYIRKECFQRPYTIIIEIKLRFGN